MKSKMQMIDYLKSHFRYHTMNSWNQATSYALCVKLNRLIWKGGKVPIKAYDFLELSESYEEVNDILHDFAVDNDHRYQIGFNGSSSGYLVLYQGGYTTLVIAPKDMQPGAKAYSDRVGRWFTYEEAVTNGWLGKTWKKIHCQPGLSIDQGETFEDWDRDAVAQRYHLVRQFDNTVKLACRAFTAFVESHDVEEQVITVPKHIKVVTPNK